VFGTTPTFSTPNINTDSSLSVKKNALSKKVTIDELNKISASLPYSSFEISYSCAKKALEMAQSMNYTAAIAEAYSNIGKYYLIQKDYLSAMKYSLLAYDLSKKIGNLRIEGVSLNLIGSIYHIIKREDRAVGYFSRALKAAEKTMDTNQIINICLNFSTIYTDSSIYKISRRYLYYSLYLALKQTNQPNEALIYKYLGRFYLSQSSYDKAIYYFEKSIAVYNKTNQQFQIGSIYTLIAHIFEMKKDYSEALKNNRIALKVRLIYNHDEQLASSLLNIGSTFLHMNRYDSGLIYLHEGTSRASEFNFNKYNLLENGYKNLHELYKKTNNNAAALECFEKYASYKDSVNDENNKRKSSILETNHYISEKEKETTELKEENFIKQLEVNNRNLFVTLLVALFFLALGVALYIRQLLVKNVKAKKDVEEINDQLQLRIKEYDFQNKELSKREQEYRFLADHSADLITMMDANFKCLYISPSSTLFLGYSPEELLGITDYRELIHENSKESFDLEFTNMMKYKDATRFIYQVIKKDGSTFWVESNINPIFDLSSGNLEAMLSITRDITSQVYQEEAMIEAARKQELLIREVNHRVKNNLAILASIVTLQKNDFKDNKTLDIFADLQFRVKTMGLIHEQLYRSRNIKILPIEEYLTNLVLMVESAFRKSQVKIKLKIDDEPVHVDTILSIGLIVNELLTNAYKYAFPNDEKGSIWVTYKKIFVEAEPEREYRCLSVRDNGIGLPIDFDISKQTTLGSQMVALLTGQVGGKMAITCIRGACFSLILPLER